MNLFNSKFILNNKRQGWIDYDRGISIILVTYRHCFESMINAGLDMKSHPWLEYINVFFFGFRMPLFFIASGMFFSGSIRKRGLAPYISNRTMNILYPMVVWGFIQISLQLIFSSYTNSRSHDQITVRSYLYLFTNPRDVGQFWYLNALFLVGVVYSVLSMKIKANYQLLLGLLFYCLCAYDNEFGFSFNMQLGFINDFLKYYLFFAIGDSISKFMLSEKSNAIFSSAKIFVTLLIAFLCIQFFFTKINLHYGSNYYVENKMPLFFLLVALVGCSVSISISVYLKNKNKLQFLRVVGYNSVHIYCMQIIIMSISRLFFVKIIGIDNVPLLALLILASGVILPIIIYNISLRFNLWWFFSLKKPEEDIMAISKVSQKNN